MKFFCLQSTDIELNEQLSLIQCDPYFQEKFVDCYRKYRGNINNILLRHSSNSYNRYIQLKWKFHVKVSSKYARTQFVPRILLRFQFTDANNKKRDFFDVECTVADIYHILNKINDALRRNNIENKLLRNIK